LESWRLVGVAASVRLGDASASDARLDQKAQSRDEIHRLRAQIDNLRETNTRVIAERDAAVEERNILIDRLSATEDDLTAPPTSLRCMIKNQTADLGAYAAD
jgi:hypothetical protein